MFSLVKKIKSDFELERKKGNTQLDHIFCFILNIFFSFFFSLNHSPNGKASTYKGKQFFHVKCFAESMCLFGMGYWALGHTAQTSINCKHFQTINVGMISDQQWMITWSIIYLASDSFISFILSVTHAWFIKRKRS